MFSSVIVLRVIAWIIGGLVTAAILIWLVAWAFSVLFITGSALQEGVKRITHRREAPSPDPSFWTQRADSCDEGRGVTDRVEICDVSQHKPGWYVDDVDPTFVRWHDGQKWTNRVYPKKALQSRGIRVH